MTGIKLGGGAHVVFFGAVDPERPNLVVTSSGSSAALPGTEPGSLKVTPYAEYPAKGRATGGVRCHRFLRGEDTLVLAWAGGEPARAAAANGVAVELPDASGRRDGSGLPATTAIAAIAGPLPDPVDTVSAHASPAPSSSVPESASPGPAAPADGPEMLLDFPEFPAGRS
jgi:DNA gyrase subunit A